MTTKTMAKGWSFLRPAGPARKAAILGAVAIATSFGLATQGFTKDAGGLSVTDGWMRSIVPSRPAGGYFTVKNDGDKDRQLTGASSPGCGMLMLHQSVSKDGADKMVMVKTVDVPAHGSATFKPGGFHLMCMQPTEMVKPGKSVPVTLKFDGGGELTSDFPVRGATGK